MNYCKCQCGKEVAKTWFRGHNRRGTTFSLSEAAREKQRLSKLGALNPRYGKPGTQLGFKHTVQARDKIKEARSRQIITKEHKLKISISLKKAYETGKRKREDSPFYVDGRHKGKTPIKQSYDYKLWRQAVFERDDYTCQMCKQRGGELQADHILPQAAFPELRFELSNGRTLCRPCHQQTDTWGLRVWNNKNKTTNVLKMI